MSTQHAPFDVERARFNMIEQQIRPWEVLDSRVLALLGEIKREDFVPAAYRSMAFADMEIPLSTRHPAVEGQCMLAPKVEARALQDLALQAGEHVLEIGTGSGYMAALMGRLCARVTSLEIDAELAAQASKNLQATGVGNVTVVHADACAQDFAACKELAPFDAIVLSGSVAEVPAALLNLLKNGGRLFAITGQEPVMRASLTERAAAASFVTSQPWDTVAPRLLNFPEAPRFQF
jgi:protein-L-isoaspartate(D-aspartate) O-methyltransferase